MAGVRDLVAEEAMAITEDVLLGTFCSTSISNAARPVTPPPSEVESIDDMVADVQSAGSTESCESVGDVVEDILDDLLGVKEIFYYRQYHPVVFSRWKGATEAKSILKKLSDPFTYNNQLVSNRDVNLVQTDLFERYRRVFFAIETCWGRFTSLSLICELENQARVDELDAALFEKMKKLKDWVVACNRFNNFAGDTKSPRKNYDKKIELLKAAALAEMSSIMEMIGETGEIKKLVVNETAQAIDRVYVNFISLEQELKKLFDVQLSAELIDYQAYNSRLFQQYMILSMKISSEKMSSEEDRGRAAEHSKSFYNLLCDSERLRIAFRENLPALIDLNASFVEYLCLCSTLHASEKNKKEEWQTYFASCAEAKLIASGGVKEKSERYVYDREVATGKALLRMESLYLRANLYFQNKEYHQAMSLLTDGLLLLDADSILLAGKILLTQKASLPALKMARHLLMLAYMLSSEVERWDVFVLVEKAHRLICAKSAVVIEDDIIEIRPSLVSMIPSCYDVFVIEKKVDFCELDFREVSLRDKNLREIDLCIIKKIYSINMNVAARAFYFGECCIKLFMLKECASLPGDCLIERACRFFGYALLKSDDCAQRSAVMAEPKGGYQDLKLRQQYCLFAPETARNLLASQKVEVTTRLGWLSDVDSLTVRDHVLPLCKKYGLPEPAFVVLAGAEFGR